MRNTIYCIAVVVAVVLFSCNGHEANSKIEGIWHAYKLENNLIDSERAWAQRVIDTLGKGNDDKTNIALYNTANMDSLRTAFQLQNDETFELQKNAVKNTIFTLKKGGTALLSFNGELDSSKWKIIDNNRQLVFRDMKGDKGDSILMDVLTLNDSLLRVRMTKVVDSIKMEIDTSIISFRKEN